MALTRKFLIDLGVEKEQIQSILDEHGETVESVKEKAKEAADLAAGKLQKKIDKLQETVDNIPEPDSEDYKAKYEDEVAAHGKTKSEYEEKETLSQKRSLAKKTLLDGGVKEDILEDFMLSTLDYDAISLKDGVIKDTDKFIEAQKERYGKYFGEVSEEGAHVDTPPTGGGRTNYKEQLETARKSGDTAAAVRIKTEAAKENIFLI